jgi:hypothetical protein
MNFEHDHSPAKQPDPLDALLLEEAAHVDDGGFTARVMQALPPRRRSVRAVALTLAFAVCCLIGIWALPPLPLLFDLAKFGLQNPQFELLLVFVPVLAAAAALGWTLYALTSEEV